MEQPSNSFTLAKISELCSTTFSNLTETIKKHSEPLIQMLEPYFERLGPHLEQGKIFYNQHKDLILIVSVATVTYILTRPSKKAEEKEKAKKKKNYPKLERTGKSFISDNSEGGFMD